MEETRNIIKLHSLIQADVTFNKASIKIDPGQRLKCMLNLDFWSIKIHIDWYTRLCYYIAKQELTVYCMCRRLCRLSIYITQINEHMTTPTKDKLDQHKSDQSKDNSGHF